MPVLKYYEVLVPFFIRPMAFFVLGLDPAASSF